MSSHLNVTTGIYKSSVRSEIDLKIDESDPDMCEKASKAMGKLSVYVARLSQMDIIDGAQRVNELRRYLE